MIFIFMIKLKHLIYESKQSIINLGYPEIIAKLFYKHFGNKAFILAKWYKEYYHNSSDDKKWWLLAHSNFGRSHSLNDYVQLYNATDSIENYKLMRTKLELSSDEDLIDDYYLKEQRELILKKIEQKLLDDSFFKLNVIISDFISGKLKNVAPYEKMRFWDANLKYDETRVFDEMTPIKTYENGYKWINVGKRCSFVGHYMKNCGSAGVMSTDADRTIISLFDSENKPHVIITYSPNENRISGDEGVGSSEVKSEYHSYIMDLANILNAKFDVDRTKSKFLKLKYLLKNKTTNIRKLKVSTVYDEYFKIKIGSEIYYTNGYIVASEAEIKNAFEKKKTQNIKLKYDLGSIIRNIFNHYNQDIFTSLGLHYIPIRTFIES